MGKFYLLSLVFFVATFFSCGDSDKALNVNVSKWNSTVSQMESVYSWAEQVKSPSDFSSLKFRVKTGQNYLNNSIEEVIDTNSPNRDEPMNSALVDYMRTCLDVLSVYEQLGDKAEALTEEEIMAHYDSLDSLSTVLGQKEIVLEEVQMAYASKNGIQLSKLQ